MNKLHASNPSTPSKKLQIFTVVINKNANVNIEKVLYKKSKFWYFNEDNSKLSVW